MTLKIAVRVAEVTTLPNGEDSTPASGIGPALGRLSSGEREVITDSVRPHGLRRRSAKIQRSSGRELRSGHRWGLDGDGHGVMSPIATGPSIE